MRIRALGFAMVGVTAGWCSAAVGQTGAAASDNSSGNTTLGEVVVTAERRRTDLQQTPIAATVLSGGDLANMGVVTVDQLMFATPGATVNTNRRASPAKLSIRRGCTGPGWSRVRIQRPTA